MIRSIAGDPLDHPMPGRFDLQRDLVCSPCGRSGRHLQTDRYEITIQLVGEVVSDDARRQQGQNDDKDCQGPGNHHDGLGRRQSEARVQRTLHESRKSAVHALLDLPDEPKDGIGRCPARAGKVRQVIRKHKQRFHQGNQQHRDKDNRQRCHDLADAAGEEEQRRECGHGCQDREDQWSLDSLSPADGCGDSRRAFQALLIDLLGHYDRIVNDDSDGENESKQ